MRLVKDQGTQVTPGDGLTADDEDDAYPDDAPMQSTAQFGYDGDDVPGGCRAVPFVPRQPPPAWRRPRRPPGAGADSAAPQPVQRLQGSGCSLGRPPLPVPPEQALGRVRDAQRRAEDPQVVFNSRLRRTCDPLQATPGRQQSGPPCANLAGMQPMQPAGAPFGQPPRSRGGGTRGGSRPRSARIKKKEEWRNSMSVPSGGVATRPPTTLPWHHLGNNLFFFASMEAALGALVDGEGAMGMEPMQAGGPGGRHRPGKVSYLRSRVVSAPAGPPPRLYERPKDGVPQQRPPASGTSPYGFYDYNSIYARGPAPEAQFPMASLR